MSAKWNSVKPIKPIINKAKTMDESVKKHAKVTCENVKTKSRNRAPVLSGRLRRGIVVVSVQDGYTVYGMEYYTIFQEAGTKWVQAKWFMRDAINEELPKFLGMPMEKMLGLS